MKFGQCIYYKSKNFHQKVLQKNVTWKPVPNSFVFVKNEAQPLFKNEISKTS